MKTYIDKIKKFLDGIEKARISVFASSGAFYFFMALAPLVTLLLSIIPYTPLSENMLNEFFLIYTPPAFQELVTGIVTQVYDSSIFTLSISALVIIWSAGQLMSSISRGISEIYDGFFDYNYFKLRFRGIIFTFIFFIFFFLNIIVIMLGEKIVMLIDTYLHDISGHFKVLVNLRGVFFTVFLTFFIAVLFRFTPKTKIKFKHHIPGAVLCAILWVLFSKIYTFILETFATFSIFGSLAVILITLVWFFYLIYILLLCAYINTRLIK